MCILYYIAEILLSDKVQNYLAITKPVNTSIKLTETGFGDINANEEKIDKTFLKTLFENLWQLTDSNPSLKKMETQPYRIIQVVRYNIDLIGPTDTNAGHKPNLKLLFVGWPYGALPIQYYQNVTLRILN